MCHRVHYFCLGWGGGGGDSPTKFPNRGEGALQDLKMFRGGCWEREGGLFQWEGGRRGVAVFT